MRPDVVVSTPHPLQNLYLQILYNFHDFYQVLDVNVETFWIMMFTWTIKLQYDCKLHQENYPCSIPLICQEDMTLMKRFSPSFTDYNNGVHTVKHSERSYKLKEKREEAQERRRKILMNDCLTFHYCDVQYLYTQGSITDSSEIPELTGLIRKLRREIRN